MRNFILACFTKYYSGNQIKEDEMDRECSTHSRDEKCVQYLLENLEGRDHFEDPDIDGIIRINLREIGWV